MSRFILQFSAMCGIIFAARFSVPPTRFVSMVEFWRYAATRKVSLFLYLQTLEDFKGLSSMSTDSATSFRDRLEAVGIRQNTFAAFARVHDADVSRVVRGLYVAASTVERMVAALVELEDLVNADHEIRPDISTVSRIRAAQKRLEERRKTATAPWADFNATALPEANAVVSSAGGILSEDRRNQ
jgi:hypothetical protein